MGKAKADHTPEQPPPARLPAADWAPLPEAFARAETSLASFDLASRDLHDHLCSGRLPSAVRYIERRNAGDGKSLQGPQAAWELDGDETSYELEASFWQEVTLRRWGNGVAVSFIDPRHVVTGSTWYFVSRRKLDELYPVGSVRIDHDDASDAQPRVRPGKRPTGDWPTEVTQWLFEVAVEDKTRLQNVNELVLEAQKFLRNRIGWAPKDDKDLRAHIVAQ